MDKLFAILLLTLSQTALHAQTIAEWFKQDKTQKKYLVQQIAALQVYTGYAEKGYAISQTGLTAIRHIKKGDFSLHSDYFKSLQAVNPQIKDDPRVEGILTLIAEINKVAGGAVKQAKKSTKVAVSEKAYVEHVLDNLSQGCKADVKLLVQVISSDQLELKDDERWKKISEVYEDIEEKYAFAKSFTASFQQLIAERSVEGKDIENEKSVLDIK